MSGIYGIASKEDCSELLFFGTDYHSHLGTAYGGMAVLGDTFNRQIHDIQNSQFKSKFYDDYRRMKGKKGLGVISDCDEQPIYINSKFGPFCIVTNGFIDNTQELVEKLLKKGISFSEESNGNVNMTELVAKLITQGSDLIRGIEKMFSLIEGSCSLLILNDDGIYAARDRFGYTPLVIGQRNNAYAVTSESSAFPNTGFEIIKHLEAGEINLINEQGVVQKRKGNSVHKICAFLWIYTGFPASNYEGINTEIVRERCGQCLARREKDTEMDFVSGVPDSGMGHAVGYSMESKKPLRRPLVKYTAGYGRSYVPPSQRIRDIIARMKLIPIREIIENKKVLLCEDSIVRGTQLKNYTIQKLWDAGANEVHIRVACPPLMFPCKYNLSTRSINELAARKAIRSIEGYDLENIDEYIDPSSEKYRQMVEWIQRDIEVTTLRYQMIDDMVSAVGLPKEKLCLYCWTGRSS